MSDIAQELAQPQDAAALVNSCPPGPIYDGGTGADVCVPGGNGAFAQSVVSFTPGIYPNAGCPQRNNQNGTASASLGPTDDPARDGGFNATPLSTSIGIGGVLTLHFTQPLTGNGVTGDGTVAGNDVFVWETGPDAEAFSVSVSADGVSWTVVGNADQLTHGAQGFDIDGNGFGPTARLYYVRIISTGTAPGTCNAANRNIAGPDIDAVAVLSSIDPEIEIVKTALAPNTDLVAGNVVNYTFAVTNTGTDVINNITVTDPLPGLSAVSCPQTTLNIGETMTCTATYTVTQADVDAGAPIPNTATVTGVSQIFSETATDTDDAVITVDQDPEILIDKNTVFAGQLAVGTVIPYTFAVTNTGTVTLTNVTVTDPLITNVAPASVATLAPNAIANFTGSYTVTQADVDRGFLTNTATATGQPPVTCTGCTPPTDTDNVTVPGAPNPQLSIAKTNDTVPGNPVTVGQVVHYNFAVTNTGNVTLYNVTVTDPLPGLGTISAASVATLAPGATQNFTAAYTVTQADIDSGNIHNTATAHAESPPECTSCPAPNQPTDDNDIPTNPAPAMALVKTASTAGPATLGQVITYTFTVTNTGNTTLHNVTVTDPLSGLSAITPASVATLAPGASTSFTATYTVTQADVDAGSITNLATAHGQNDPSCTTCPTPNEPTDGVEVPTNPQPAMTLDKTASTAGPATLGQSIVYTFTVTNTGNSTLHNVTVTDPLPGLGTISPASVSTVAPGGTATFTASYTVTQADINAGSITNLATAHGENDPSCTTCPEPNEPTDGVEIPTDANPALTIDKTASTAGPATLGQVITYTFTVTNAGTTTLHNVSVTDPLPGLSTITPASVATLAPGASTNFTATYTVIQADVDAGHVLNTATAHGENDPSCTGCPEPNEPTDTVDLPTNPAPAMTLSKTASTAGPASLGDLITYTFTVTNTGNSTLHNVTVTDPLPGLSALTPASVATLAVGASTSFTATYTVTQADVDAGNIHNVATAHGENDPSCTTCPEPNQPTDNVDVPTDPAPAMVLTKTANTAGPVTLGQVITYTFTVTNTGNSTLHNVTVTDPLSGLSAIAPASVATLAPGASTDFTATYTVTQTDINAGVIHNVATAHGENDPSCTTCPPPQ